MMSQQYETRRYSSNAAYLIRAFGEGFKRCTGCDILVKIDGWRCPTCKRLLKTRTNTRSKKKVMEAFKKIKPKPSKVCSKCGALHSKLTKKLKWTYEKWSRDGNGGWLCWTCYQQNNIDRIREYKRAYDRNNNARRRAYQKKRSQKPGYKERKRQEYQKNVWRMRLYKKLRLYNPLNLKLPVIKIG